MEQEKESMKEKKEVVAKGKDLPISTKQSMAICRAINGKKINSAMEMLQKVEKKQRAIAMKGEIPHRRGIGGGRYPIKAAKVFLKLLKSLGANASVKGVDAEKLIIFCKADKAGKSMKPGRRSRKFKRTHVTLIGTEK